jgi:hypothetical protein
LLCWRDTGYPRGAEREAWDSRPGRLQSMGTRALIAETLAAQAGNVQKAVVLLCEAAGNGDLAAAKALVPYFDQALGKPTERVEFRTPSTLAELETLSEEELERLVAQGRADRLRREREEAGGLFDDDDDAPDWRARSVE